jgi:hypothetical protein
MPRKSAARPATGRFARDDADADAGVSADDAA